MLILDWPFNLHVKIQLAMLGNIAYRMSEGSNALILSYFTFKIALKHDTNRMTPTYNIKDNKYCSLLIFLLASYILVRRYDIGIEITNVPEMGGFLMHPTVSYRSGHRDRSTSGD